MRPRLASLALLLLALCRRSTADTITINKEVSQKQEQSISINTKKVEVKKAKVSTPEVPGADMNAVMQGNGGNLNSIIFAYGPACGEPLKDTPDVIKRALDNGIQCAVDTADMGSTFTKALYGSATVIPKAKPVEDKLAAQVGIVCTTPAPATPTPEYDCYCTKNYSAFFCAALKYKATIKTPKGTCKKEALEALTAVAKNLGPVYNWEALSSKDSVHNKNIAAVFKGGSEAVDAIEALDKAIIGFFCEAADPAVEAAFKTLYTSDFSFSTVESILLGLGFGDVGLKNLNAACKGNSAWKTSTFGKCLCPFDKGFSFCVYQALGVEFKNQGFITCEDNKKEFVKEKKPSALPQLVPPSAAATSSLLLLPLSVAAALLLLH